MSCVRLGCLAFAWGCWVDLRCVKEEEVRLEELALERSRVEINEGQRLRGLDWSTAYQYRRR